MPDQEPARRLSLVACGILEKEVRRVIDKNRWPVTARFLPSSLHVDFGRLRGALEASLRQPPGAGRRAVFYGECHPLMGRMMSDAGAIRTPGQNCVEICLGLEVFERELRAGAFFLFEDWARGWETIIGGPKGMPPVVMREIFTGAHRYVLGVRTPCSGDFSEQARQVAADVGLELRWIDVGLDHLEDVLRRTIDKAMEESR